MSSTGNSDIANTIHDPDWMAEMTNPRIDRVAPTGQVLRNFASRFPSRPTGVTTL